jgi:uncharacterized RDD family membrane protein YckC
MNTLDEDSNAFDELKDKLAQTEDYYEIAGPGKRFANYLIDLVVWYLIAIVLMLAVVFLSKDATLLDNKFLSYLITIVAMVSYYVFFEALTGQTIGKMITKTKVLNEFGGKPTLSQIFGRSFSRLIPFEAFSFLGNGWGWHDRFPGTKVVNMASKKIDELV